MTEPEQLEELRAEFARQWSIWRSQLDGKPASWCASLRSPAFGVDQTVIQDSAEDLRAALKGQRERAERGVRTYGVSTDSLPSGGRR